jgi:hypothetical protein
MAPRLNFTRYFAQKEMNVPSPVRAFMAAAGALLATGALCASAAQAAPVLYGATGVSASDTLPASNLYTINPDTGAATSVGSIGRAITGLAVDHADGGKLYGVTAGVYLSGAGLLPGTALGAAERQLVSINPATGASTVIGSLGANEVEDIAFTALGQLYGWNESGDDLYRIDKATGALTKVGESNLAVTFGDGLAFDRNGWLWGALDGDAGHMFRIDPATGKTTIDAAGHVLGDVDPTSCDPSPTTCTLSRRYQGTRLTSSPNKTGAMVSSADFACDGLTMYGVVNDFGGAANLVTIDTATGIITNKGASVTGLDAIAWGGCTVPQTSPGGTVPATLSLSLGAPVTFGAFTPGVAKTYLASTTANVISTAGDATLSIADASSTATGHLVNGSFVLPEFLQARAGNAATPASTYANVGSSSAPLSLLTWSAPVSNDAVSIEFSQLVKANDALRTGAYSKTLTFTLSTTTP